MIGVLYMLCGAALALSPAIIACQRYGWRDPMTSFEMLLFNTPLQGIMAMQITASLGVLMFRYGSMIAFAVRH